MIKAKFHHMSIYKIDDSLKNTIRQLGIENHQLLETYMMNTITIR